jgi:hypothetical protein
MIGEHRPKPPAPRLNALAVWPFWLIAIVAGLLLSGPSAHAAGLLEGLLRFLGVSAAPSQMKGPDGGGTAVAGRIWIVDLSDGARRPLTQDGGYRWPIFQSDGTAVIALRGNKVVRISLGDGKLVTLQDAPDVEKLVGVNTTQPEEVLVVRNDAAAPLAVLSLKSGRLTTLPYDRKAKDQRQMLSHLRGETRVYGRFRLFLQTETRPTMEGGTREWQNVYLQDGEAAPRPISRCQDVTCHQPSLSPSSTRVAYVQSDPSDK